MVHYFLTNILSSTTYYVFLGSNVINRTEPWYFYILTLVWGLFPHIFVTLKLKDITFKNKFLVLNLIAILSILGFFSLSETKLITYILPIYPFFAVLIGEVWYKYINNSDKIIENSLIVFNSFLTLATIIMFFIGFLFPQKIYINFQPVQIVSLLILIPFVTCNWVFIIKKQRLKQFLSIVIFMSLLSGFVTPLIYKFNYTFGQDDLMKFAKIAKENNCTISTYLTGKKYALLYYGNQTKIDFQTENDLNWLYNELNKKNHIVITRNNEIQGLPVKIKEQGVKYSIIERLDYEK